MLDVGHMFDSVIIVWVFVVFFSLAYIGVGCGYTPFVLLWVWVGVVLGFKG